MCFLLSVTVAHGISLPHDDRSDSDDAVDNHLVKRRTKTSFGETTNNGHNKTERLNLLREFVLDDFSSDEQNSDVNNAKKVALHNMRQDRYTNTIRDEKQLTNYLGNQQDYKLSKNESSSDLSPKPQNALQGNLNFSKTYSRGSNHMGSRSGILQKPLGMQISSTVIKDRLRNQEIPLKKNKNEYNEKDPWNQSSTQRSEIEEGNDGLVLKFPTLEQTEVVRKLYPHHSSNSVDIGAKNNGQPTISHQQINRLNTRHHYSKSELSGNEENEKVWNDNVPYDSEKMLLPSKTKTLKTSRKNHVPVYHDDNKLLNKRKNDFSKNDNESHVVEHQDMFSETKFLGRNDKNTIKKRRGNSGDSPSEERFLGSSSNDQINSTFGVDDYYVYNDNDGGNDHDNGDDDDNNENDNNYLEKLLYQLEILISPPPHPCEDK